MAGGKVNVMAAVPRVARLALVAGSAAALALAIGRGATRAQEPPAWRFHLVEATIADVHRAIVEKQITCRAFVQAYVDRARAYNGTATRLVTEDDAPQYFPDYTEYKAAVLATAALPVTDPRKTLPIEFGRMEATASDPTVRQQYGMVAGVPDAGQLRALNTLNIRGERSVTCKGAFDRAPADGPLPAEAPAVCDAFRQQPDALERAAELDAQYGNAPDLAAMPMYCVPFSFKDSFDTSDMRSTGGGDARYDMDFTARDHTLVAQLRLKGAIIYAKANLREYNGGGGDPGGSNAAGTIFPAQAGPGRSAWGGNPVNVYDTSRAPSLGSSSGSGVSVGANLVMCSLCEETRQSCRGPANHNGAALLLPRKAGLSFLGGGIGADVYNDRTGIICRDIGDAVRVFDALKDSENGFYDARDVFTTVPRSSIPGASLAAALQEGTPGALTGMRIGIVREFMIKHAKVDEPIVDAVAAEMKEVLGKRLGATLVESVTPGWIDDPHVENMTTTFDRALAGLTPVLFPDLLYRLTPSGEPAFPGFAANIEPTEFRRGVKRGSGSMQPVDWMLRWAEGLEPPPSNLNLRSVLDLELSRANRFHMSQYLMRRAKDWKDRGFTETLDTFPELNARSKFFSEGARAAFMNWSDVRDLRNPIGERQGVAERIQLRELLQRVIVKVVQENRLDLIVNLHSALPPARIGGASEPSVHDRGVSYPMGPNAGITEMLIPAGFVRTVYDPTLELATAPSGRKFYRSKSSTTPTELPAPGLPFSMSFWAEPGMEHVVVKAASAYQSASRRRVPPPAFGPLPGEP
jgi:Asp-tRNA(Asn)/Glu-tRNA(Gln) amidotransferase A subunit family amidase